MLDRWPQDVVGSPFQILYFQAPEFGRCIRFQLCANVGGILWIPDNDNYNPYLFVFSQ